MKKAVRIHRLSGFAMFILGPGTSKLALACDVANSGHGVVHALAADVVVQDPSRDDIGLAVATGPLNFGDCCYLLLEWVSPA